MFIIILIIELVATASSFIITFYIYIRHVGCVLFYVSLQLTSKCLNSNNCQRVQPNEKLRNAFTDSSNRSLRNVADNPTRELQRNWPTRVDLPRSLRPINKLQY